MRYKFQEVFDKKYDQSITPKQCTRICGASIGQGTFFHEPKAMFCGFDVYSLLDKDIEAEEVNGVLIIKGYYENQQLNTNGGE